MVIGSSHGSVLTRWLRTLDAGRLQGVLDTRADCARPPEPRTLGELADRLQRPGSVARALPLLSRPCLQVAEALAALGAPAPRTELESLLGTDAARLDTALCTLGGHALVWPGPDGVLHMAAALRDAWETPLGLGTGLDELLSGTTSDALRRIATTLGLAPGTKKRERLAAVLDHHRDPDRLRALLDSAPPRALDLLERTVRRDRTPIMFGSVTEDPAERWLWERALLVGRGWSMEPARVPAEVTRALRGPSWHAPFDPVPPELPFVSLTASDVESDAAAAAASFTGQAGALLRECAARPVTALKSGGVGARELARLGKAIGCDEPVVRLVLETAYAAGLLAYEQRALSVTEAYDGWAGADPADQFASLLHAWWLLGLTPSGSRDEAGKALPAVGRTSPCAGCLAARQGLLTAAAGLPAAHGARNPADLGPLVTWHRPLAHELPQDTTPFAGLIREVELLGLLARGALSPFGAAVLHDNEDLLHTHARRLLPGATSRTRIGADLTAVVMGTPTGRLAALLDSLADREAHGTASVWRFGPSSLRRALDAGRTPAEIQAALSDTVDGQLPQTLTYLIADTARKHGRLRLATTACVIHSNDTALLAEIAAHRTLSRLGLRSIAPGVLLCRTPLPEALDALRTEGYAPVAESEDGAVRLERPRQTRATQLRPRPRQHPRHTAPPPGLALRLLSAPDREPHPDPGRGVPFQSDTEEILAGYAKALNLTDIRQLAHAIHEHEPLTLEYLAVSGNRTIRTVSELELDPPLLSAYCHLREDQRVFTLSRIQAVMPT